MPAEIPATALQLQSLVKADQTVDQLFYGGGVMLKFFDNRVILDTSSVKVFLPGITDVTTLDAPDVAVAIDDRTGSGDKAIAQDDWVPDAWKDTP